ncbi:MAG: phenylacetate-CoA oxygenase/reductase subunit PaaK [Saprospiraceae bacterium]|nr:phenylacetate-CoA oxygenase/reductase subunit PaaK [Saprospiraceae bacterium]
MPKFHKLSVREVRRETPECVSISFDVPAEVRSEYDFLPGQHLTLRTHLDGSEIRRSYSICTSPMEGELRVAVKQVPGGQFSGFANERLQSGDELDVMTPLGNFALHTDPSALHNYVAFAAGSGITPVISMLKTVLRNEPGSRFTLFYGNKNSESVIFREEIEGLKNEHMTRLAVHYVLSQEDPGIELFHGRIDAEKCRKFCQHLMDVEAVDGFYLCGPAPMIEAVRSTLLELGVDERKLHSELFNTTGAIAESRRDWAKSGGAATSSITLTLDGKTYSYQHINPSETILDAGANFAPELPYACKGGVCCTCKAKVLEGEVEMEVCYGLEKEEIAAGYVLTCQSHPKTDKVVLSFDE